MLTARRAPTFPPATPTEALLIVFRIAIVALLALLLLASDETGSAVAVEDGFRPDAAGYVRRSTDPPTDAELDRLAGMARSAPLWVAAPPAGLVRVLPPARPRAGRNAAIEWSIRGAPGDTVGLVLSDAGGPLDSARIVLDASGEAEGGFRVHPARAGWHDWTLTAGTAARTVGAWVRGEAPLRVLVTGAAGSVEARETARALERAGARVTFAASPGRGLRLGDAPAGLPADSAGFAAWDVVVVLAGTDLRNAAGLAAFLERGGGAVLAGEAAGLRTTASPPAPIRADAIRWRTPAVLEPLPPAPLDLVARTLDGEGVAAAEPAVLRLGNAGRGRWAALGIEDTWRWALQRGSTEELADFWRSLADWLAGGLAEPVAVTVRPATAAPGIPVDIVVGAFGDDRPAQVSVSGPGLNEELPLTWNGDEGRARFVAPGPGDYGVRLPGRSAGTGHHADPQAPPPDDAWARLASLADASGGGLVPAGLLPRTASRGGFDRQAAMVALIVLLTFVEWTVRRLQGRA